MAKNLKPKPEEKEAKKTYSPDGDEKKVRDQFITRKAELLNSRKNVNGVDIDARMKKWDIDYFNREANIPASELDPDQKPIAINNAYSKVQTGLSLLIDKNPEYVLEEDHDKYTANKELIRTLGQKSWRNTNSLGQLKLSVFNSAKRGWGCGRTYYKHLEHEAEFLQGVEDGKKKYGKSTVTKVDDVAYMNLDNHNVWIDEEARPEDMYSIRDWMWREVWHIDKVRAMFPKEEYPNMEFVSAGGDTSERVDGNSQEESNGIGSDRETKVGMTEIFFYENQYDDWFIVEVNGIMLKWEPLPQNHKRISLVVFPWHLRSAETIYGIGVIEEMERDESLIDRIMNLSMRQLLLSIQPFGFYAGTDDMEDENFKIKAGTFKRVQNPDAIKWVEIPEGNTKGLETINWLENKEDNRTGINKTIEGEVESGKGDTAFELGIAREASLKRLKLPLRSIQYGLDWEFKNRIDLIRQVYSTFKVEHLVDPDEIQAYLDETNADPEFYHIEKEGEAGKEQFFAKRFRRVKIGVDQDEEGNFVESDEEKFFTIKPEFLPFEGDVSTKMTSLLVVSEELEKADTLRMSNILIPLFQGSMETNLKPVKQILKKFNADPRKWLPEDWLEAEKGKTKETEKAEVPENVQKLLGGGEPEQPATPETVVPPDQVDPNPSLSGRLGAAFQAFKQP